MTTPAFDPASNLSKFSDGIAAPADTVCSQLPGQEVEFRKQFDGPLITIRFSDRHNAGPQNIINTFLNVQRSLEDLGLGRFIGALNARPGTVTLQMDLSDAPRGLRFGGQLSELFNLCESASLPLSEFSTSAMGPTPGMPNCRTQQSSPELCAALIEGGISPEILPGGARNREFTFEHDSPEAPLGQGGYIVGLVKRPTADSNELQEKVNQCSPTGKRSEQFHARLSLDKSINGNKSIIELLDYLQTLPVANEISSLNNSSIRFGLFFITATPAVRDAIEAWPKRAEFIEDIGEAPEITVGD